MTNKGRGTGMVAARRKSRSPAARGMTNRKKEQIPRLRLVMTNRKEEQVHPLRRRDCLPCRELRQSFWK